jgi:hypothetical protein
LRGSNLSPVAALAVEFLRFLDGLRVQEDAIRGAERHQEVLDAIVRGSLVSTDRYDEKRVFKEYFPPEDAVQGGLVGSDAETDFDYEDVTWEAPSEGELEILQRMLEDPSVTLSAEAFGPPEDFEVFSAPPDDAPVMESIENNREWV